MNTPNLSDLRNFKSIRELPDAFRLVGATYYSQTKRIDIPENVTYIGSNSLGFTTNTIVVFHGKIPPRHVWTFSGNSITYDTCTPNGCKFYVPDESLEAYKKAFTSLPAPLVNDSIIHPMSELYE